VDDGLSQSGKAKRALTNPANKMLGNYKRMTALLYINLPLKIVLWLKKAVLKMSGYMMFSCFYVLLTSKLFL
jgi:hypothetical protein